MNRNTDHIPEGVPSWKHRHWDVKEPQLNTRPMSVTMMTSQWSNLHKTLADISEHYGWEDESVKMHSLSQFETVLLNMYHSLSIRLHGKSPVEERMKTFKSDIEDHHVKELVDIESDFPENLVDAWSFREEYA